MLACGRVCLPAVLHACPPACLHVTSSCHCFRYSARTCGLSLLFTPGIEDLNCYSLNVGGWVSVCLCACQPACLPACWPARLPACLLACVPARLPACMPACLPACLDVCLPGLSFFVVLACAPACPSACLSISPPRLPLFFCFVGLWSLGSLRRGCVGFLGFSFAVGFFWVLLLASNLKAPSSWRPPFFLAGARLNVLELL